MSDQSTGGMWANMLGLGPLFATINDPQFQAQIRAIVAAITETAERCQRIEYKIDLLLQAGMIDAGDIPIRPVIFASIPVGMGADGSAGRRVVAGELANDGGSEPPPIGQEPASRSGDGTGSDRPMRVLGGVR